MGFEDWICGLEFYFLKDLCLQLSFSCILKKVLVEGEGGSPPSTQINFRKLILVEGGPLPSTRTFFPTLRFAKQRFSRGLFLRFLKFRDIRTDIL